MAVLSKVRFFASFESPPRIASATTILIGGIALVGWLFAIPTLKSVLPGLATMKANTALCFVLAGMVLWILHDEQPTPRQRRLARIGALAVLLIALLTLSEYLLGFELGIDQLLFRDNESSLFPGRMAQSSAAGLLLLGLALWLLGEARYYTLTQIMALMVLALALLTLVGYLLGVAALYGVFAFTSVALPTALALLTTSTGILLARPKRGVMAVITADRLGGKVARQLLPAVLLIPLLFGWLRLQGQRQGLYDTEFGLALFALSNIFTFALLVWWNARSLNRADESRQQAATALQRSAQRLEMLHQIDLALIQGDSIQEMVETVVQQIRHLVPCQRVDVTIIDETTNEALLFAEGINGDTQLGQGVRFPIPPNVFEGYDARHSQLFDDLRLWQDTRPRARQLVSEGLLCAFSVLLMDRDRPMGSLGLFAATPGFFTAEYQEIAAEVAGQLSIAIKQMHLSEELERRAAELEEKVIERTTQLTAVNRELEAFSHSVSHDLRAPLRALNGFSTALVEDYGDQLAGEAQHYLNRIVAASQHMGHLVDALLEMARLSRIDMSKESVNLSALAKEIVADLQADQPDRQVEVAIADDLLVEGDARLLKVVLNNLLRNAWKFSSKQAHARIEVGVMEQQGKSVFFVRDNGAGFDMRYADKLFDAFQRLHRTDEFEGTGIGLATVQRIIHRHNGKIWAESVVNEGATFYFTLNTDHTI